MKTHLIFLFVLKNTLNIQNIKFKKTIIVFRDHQIGFKKGSQKYFLVKLALYFLNCSYNLNLVFFMIFFKLRIFRIVFFKHRKYYFCCSLKTIIFLLIYCFKKNKK